MLLLDKNNSLLYGLLFYPFFFSSLFIFSSWMDLYRLYSSLHSPHCLQDVPWKEKENKNKNISWLRANAILADYEDDAEFGR